MSSSENTLDYNVLCRYSTDHKRTTSSHNCLHGQVQFVPSVYIQCWDTTGKYSGCEWANWGLHTKTLPLHCFTGMFYYKTHLVKEFGCLFSLIKVSSSGKEVTFLKETLHVDLLTRSSSHRTPTFIIHCMGMPLTKQGTASAHNSLHGKVQFVPSLCFQCWDTAGKYARLEPTSWALWAKTLFSLFESENVSLSNPPGKHFGC